MVGFFGVGCCIRLRRLLMGFARAVRALNPSYF
jgi:hypothetical protein